MQTAEGRWYTMRMQPYRTMDNVIEGAVLTFVDVTAARTLQATQRLNEERLRVALGTASISVFDKDANLRYTRVHDPNPGFTAEEIIGKADADLLPEQEAAALTAIKQQVLGSGEGTRQDVRTTIAGVTFVHDLTIEPLCDAAGTAVGITCSSLEVAGRRGSARPRRATHSRGGR